MSEADSVFQLPPHDHVFLGEDHEKAERRTWAVIILCSVMMIAEIIGGALFGSLALIADGLHMSTHAGALLLAALAYTYARKYANDRNFTFGTGKFGDLAAYSSAIVLAMIARADRLRGRIAPAQPGSHQLQRGDPDCRTWSGGQCRERVVIGWRASSCSRPWSLSWS